MTLQLFHICKHTHTHTFTACRVEIIEFSIRSFLFINFFISSHRDIAIRADINAFCLFFAYFVIIALIFLILPLQVVCSIMCMDLSHQSYSVLKSSHHQENIKKRQKIERTAKSPLGESTLLFIKQQKERTKVRERDWKRRRRRERVSKLSL